MAAFMSPVPLLDGVSNRLWSWLLARIGRIIGRTPRFVYLVPIVYWRSLFSGERKTS